MYILNYIKLLMMIVMFGSVAYLAFVAIQPREVIVTANETDKQLAAVWKNYSNTLYEGYNELIKNYQKLSDSYENLQMSFLTLQETNRILFNANSIPRFSAFDYTTASDSRYKPAYNVCGKKYWDKGVYCDYRLECTPSMKDIFTCHNLVVIYKTDNIKTGDIIAFRLQEPILNDDEDGDEVSINFLIHRVVGINETGFITKGDFNERNDYYQPAKEDIIGKVKEVWY